MNKTKLKKFKDANNVSRGRLLAPFFENGATEMDFLMAQISSIYALNPGKPRSKSYLKNVVKKAAKYLDIKLSNQDAE